MSVNKVDKTDGSLIPIAGYAAQEKVDAVTDGDMRAVTSNAVADELAKISTVVDLTNNITQESGYTSGYVTVEKCGHIVTLYFHSLVVNAYDATVLSGFPKPTANNFYIVVQGDGNPQTIGIAFMDGYGNLKSGSSTGGLVPGVVWDGVATYFTND